MESDETYRKSLTEVRASLDSEREREVLATVLTELRAWRSPEHRELMETPTLTPAQREMLKELELQHSIKLYEMLHGQDPDGIARAYNKYLLAWLTESRQDQADEIALYEEAADVQVTVEELPQFESFPGSDYVSRRVPVLVQNNSTRVVGTLAVRCVLLEDCKEGDCGDEVATLEIHGLGLEEGLQPGERARISGYQQRGNEEPGLFVGMKPENLRCWPSILDLKPDSVLEEPQLVTAYWGPEARLTESRKSFAMIEKNIERTRKRNLNFETLVTLFATHD